MIAVDVRRRFAARAAIIDLDGTLLDTAADLAVAVNAMLSAMGRATLPVEQVASYVGKGVEVLVHRALTLSLDGRVPADSFAPAMQSFDAHYRRENGRHASVYPGVLEGLQAMRDAGLKLSVVTNKPIGFALPLLADTGLAQYFDLVVGGDTVARKKPDPMPMLHVCAQLGIAPEQVVAIGDSLNDVLAARAAGMAVLAVPYGYNEGRDARSLDVDAIVDTLFEASHLIDPL